MGFLTTRRFVSLYQTTAVPAIENYNINPNEGLLLSSNIGDNLGGIKINGNTDIKEFLISNGRMSTLGNGLEVKTGGSSMSQEVPQSMRWWWPTFQVLTETSKNSNGQTKSKKSQPRQITNKSREQNPKGSNKLRENSIENSYYMSLTPTLNKRELDKVPKEKPENEKTVSIEAEDRTDKNKDSILSSS